jgi:hypothetical protein
MSGERGRPEIRPSVHSCQPEGAEWKSGKRLAETEANNNCAWDTSRALGEGKTSDPISDRVREDGWGAGGVDSQARVRLASYQGPL